MKKIIILILLLFNTATHFLKAQQVTSLLTQVTTDLLQGETRNSFSWKNMPLSIFGSTSLAKEKCKLGDKRWNKEWLPDGAWGTAGEYYVLQICMESGWHGTSTIVSSLSSVSSDDPNSPTGPLDPYGPLFGDHPDDWYPGGPTLPNDQGGGGAYDPNDPHGTPSNDPDKDPKSPDKPSDKFEDDNNNSNTVSNSPCPKGQYKDSCGECVGGKSGKLPCIKGCDSVWGSGAKLDSCSKCVGGTTKKMPCKTDCAGVLGGTAAKDSCGNCAGGTSNVVACNKIPCQTDSTMKVTREMIKKLAPMKKFKTTADSITYNKVLDSVPKYLNLYMRDFGIISRDALACFLAVAAQETNNFIELVEDYRYSKGAIRDNFDDALFPDSIINNYVNCLCVFDRAYAEDCDTKKHTNCDEASKDGSTYRGRGLFHLTHKDSYWRFTKYYQKKYNDYTVDFETTPSLLETNFKFVVLSGLWELAIDKSKASDGKDKKDAINPLKQAQLGNFESVMNAINKYDSNKPDKRKKREIMQKLLCLYD